MSHRKLAKAISIACRAPDNHPFRVAEQALNDSLGDEGLLVALLHDCIEDGYASRKELAQEFPGWVQDAVWELTRREGESYAAYIERIAEGSVLARNVKLADLRVNHARCVVDGNDLIRRYRRAIERLEGVS